MSDFSEFYRFRKQVSDNHTCEAVESWFKMRDESKQAIRERWEKEDKEQAKIYEIDGGRNAP